MAKLKSFTENVRYQKQLDEQISNFLQFLEDNKHTLIDVKTIACGTNNSGGNLDHLRTKILYKENYTRKVIVEKNE